MIFGGARRNADVGDPSFYLGTTEDRAYKPWGGMCYKMNEEGETAASPHSSKAATATTETRSGSSGSGVIEIDDHYQEQQVFDVDSEVALIDLCHEVTGDQEKVNSWMAELPCSRYASCNSSRLEQLRDDIKDLEDQLAELLESVLGDTGVIDRVFRLKCDEQWTTLFQKGVQLDMARFLKTRPLPSVADDDDDNDSDDTLVLGSANKRKPYNTC